MPVVLTKRDREQLRLIGVEVKNLSDKDRRIFKTKGGVKVTAVPQDDERKALLGRVIIAVNNEEIDDLDDARSAFEDLGDARSFSITTIDENGERERIIFR